MASRLFGHEMTREPNRVIPRYPDESMGTPPPTLPRHSTLLLFFRTFSNQHPRHARRQGAPGPHTFRSKTFDLKRMKRGRQWPSVAVVNHWGQLEFPQRTGTPTELNISPRQERESARSNPSSRARTPKDYQRNRNAYPMRNILATTEDSPTIAKAIVTPGIHSSWASAATRVSEKKKARTP